MENNDKTVVNMLEYAKRLKEKENREQIMEEVISEIRDGRLKKNNLNLEMKERNFFNDKVTLYMPKSYKIMPEKLVKIKYPSEARPSIIYTSKDDTVNIGLNYLPVQVSNNMVIEFRNSMKDAYILNNRSATIIDKDHFKIGDSIIAYYSFNSLVPGGQIFNLISILSLDDKALICNFNCLEKDRQKLEILFYGMIKTIEIL